MHQDLQAAAHPVDLRPAAQNRHAGAVVGVRRSHDRDRETGLTVGPEQCLLASDLAPRILPVRVVQRSRLRHRYVSRWLVVRRGRADEHVLTGPTTEQVHIGPNVLGFVRDEVDDHVELPVTDGCSHRGDISDVGPQDFGAGRCRPERGEPSVEDCDVMAGCQCARRACGADDPGAADEEDPEPSHAASLPSLITAGWGRWSICLSYVERNPAGESEIPYRGPELTQPAVRMSPAAPVSLLRVSDTAAGDPDRAFLVVDRVPEPAAAGDLVLPLLKAG